jgi:hypothetical protein
VEDARQIEVTTPYLRQAAATGRSRYLRQAAATGRSRRSAWRMNSSGVWSAYQRETKTGVTRFTFAKADRQATTRLVHGYCQRRITARAGRQLPETQPLRMP